MGNRREISTSDCPAAVFRFLNSSVTRRYMPISVKPTRRVQPKSVKNTQNSALTIVPALPLAAHEDEYRERQDEGELVRRLVAQPWVGMLYQGRPASPIVEMSVHV